MFIIKRYPENPILAPEPGNSWEAGAVFNGCPVKKDDQIYLLYRAISLPHYHTKTKQKMSISDIGKAQSIDGIHFSGRMRFITGEESWEIYGTEDPRVTKFEGKYYIFYTALSDFPFTPQGIKVGLAISKDLGKVDQKQLVTPFNAKAMALFPDRVNGKICAILTANTDLPPSKLAIAFFDDIKQIWSTSFWNKWYGEIDRYTISLRRRTEDHVELGAAPIKTDKGWLIIYSYIRNYFTQSKVFGIEAALLDLNDPLKVIARTSAPLITPEETYELYGVVPKVIFPSGAMVKDDELWIYYSGADTVVCLMTTKLSDLLDLMINSNLEQRVSLKRSDKNPIIAPIKNHSWESLQTFNPAAIYEDRQVHLIYRAIGDDKASVFGYAASKDGLNIDYREPKPIYLPRADFEKRKKGQVGFGCEDPRVTKIGSTIYMCYTAYDGESSPRVALTSIPVEDFLNKNWDWSYPKLISPPCFDDKDAVLFPEIINGWYLFFHRIGDDIDYSFVKELDFDGSVFLGDKRWIKLREGFWDSRKLGVAAPPIKTDKGWVMFYHGVSKEDHTYRVGAVLLDLADPIRIIGRTFNPLFEPEESYEKEGDVHNVVFPCGNVLVGEKVFVYYGGGDRVVGVASIEIKKLLEILQGNF